MITVNANLFRIVAMCQSTDPTRFYLAGVYLEPGPGGLGVVMTATNGRVLTTAYDEQGDMDGASPVIIGLPKPTLSACKATSRGESSLAIDVTSSSATITLNGTETARAGNVVVDGTFPDWRRVIPTVKSGALRTTHFRAPVMKVITDTAAALSSPVTINSDGDEAALVCYSAAPHVVSVALPASSNRTGDHKATRPYWM